MSWYLSVWKNYAKFSGRARRKEFWMFALLNVVVIAVLAILPTVTDVAELMYLYFAYALAVLVPGLAVTVRRLHDTGKSGLWYFIALVPFIGGLWLLVLLAGEGQREANAYGSDPKAITA